MRLITHSGRPIAAGLLMVGIVLFGSTSSVGAQSPLSVTGFSPSQGAVGVQVSLVGSDFSDATDVQFAGSSSAFTVVDDSEISTTVPAGAASGPISVVTPDGTATSID